MKIVVGLGNFGDRYAYTFHNMGFLAAECLADKLNLKFDRRECDSLIAVGYRGGEKLVIAKPLTYMNLSGVAVKQLLAKNKATENDLVVIYDDIDLPKGALRVREKGSAGTHNGMRSVIGETGWTNFPRIRIGIRDSAVNIPIIDYVLSEIRKEDYELFAEACGRAADAAVAFASGVKIEDVMNKFNG